MSTCHVLGPLVALCVAFVVRASSASPYDNIVLPPAIPDKLVAEGYIYLDRKSLERYLKEEDNVAKAEAALKKDVEFFISEANGYYQSLQQYGLNIQLRTKTIRLLNKDLVSGKEITNGDVINEKTIIDNFRDFLMTPAEKENKYDFALLFTGYNLKDPTAGFAQEGAMCRPFARGVVELHGLMNTASVFAHEVGHIFGSKHDLTGDFIMAEKMSNEHTNDIFQFSKLTADYILKYLHKDSRNRMCLRATSINSKIPHVTPEQYNGKMQDLDYLCKRANGPKSTPCVSSWYYNNETEIAGDDVCFHVACRKPDQPNMCVTTIRTPEGIPCGKNKECKRGKCVLSNAKKYKTANSHCLFGEEKNPEGKGMSCPQYIAYYGGQSCERPSQYSACCETCPKYATGWKDCPFGDSGRVGWNGEESTCAEVVTTTGKNEACHQFKKSCCKTCRVPDELKNSECPYGDDNFVHVNNKKQTCAAVVREFGKASACQNEYISSRCCKSCQKPPGSTPSCPYGDDDIIKVNGKLQSCLQAAKTASLRNLCGSSYGKMHCCKTCSVPAGAPKGCPYGDDSTVVVNGKRMSCTAAAAEYTKQSLCSTSLKVACCKTCA